MISENRLSHLAHLVREELKKQKAIETQDEMQLLQNIKQGFNEFVKIHNEVDRAAKALISNQKKGIQEGSIEWDVLYGRFYEQELQRRGI